MARDGRRQGAEDRAAAPDLHGGPGPRVPGHRLAVAVVLPAWSLKVRRGPKVAKSAHPELVGALRALEEQLRVVPERGPATAFRREYAPVQQVVARGELRGPRRVRGGVDVRGDGSAEAWTGRFSRQVIEARPAETAYAALGRELAARVGV